MKYLLVAIVGFSVGLASTLFARFTIDHQGPNNKTNSGVVYVQKTDQYCNEGYCIPAHMPTEGQY